MKTASGDARYARMRDLLDLCLALQGTVRGLSLEDVSKRYHCSSRTARRMLSAVREEFDRAASRRAEENAAMRGIFQKAGTVVTDGDLTARCNAAAGEVDASLRVSDLEETNTKLRQLLIDVQSHVEELEGDGRWAVVPDAGAGRRGKILSRA